MNNFIYHYSTTPLPDLRSLNLLQNTASNGDDDYRNNVSFFFDPIPSSKIVRLFPKDHPFWVSGKTIYEHVVDVEYITESAIIGYWVAESAEKLRFMDRFVEEHNWTTDDPALLNRYKKELLQMQLANGERGKTKLGLLRQIQKHRNITERAFELARLRDDFHENSHKYAANVPHLMLYINQPISVKRTLRLVLGSDTRVQIKASASSKNW